MGAPDALESGPLNNWPYFPRRRDGSPLWSDTAETDGIQVDGVTPMPRGLRTIRRGRERLLIDVTPRAGNEPVNPPTLAP